MKFEDIPAEIKTFRVKCTESSGNALKEQAVFAVDPMPSRNGEFEVRLKDSVVSVTPVLEPDIRLLNAELANGQAILAQFVNPASDGSIELQIAFFTGECLEMGEIEIGVDEYVEKGMAKLARRGKKLKGQELHESLEELCCFHQGDRTHFFLTAGPAIDSALKPEPPPGKRDEEAEKSNDVDKPDGPEGDVEDASAMGDETNSQKPEPTRKNSFCLTGDGIRFISTETSLRDGNAIWTVTRLTKIKKDTDRALRLASGKLAFVDWTQAGQIQILTKAQMSALTKDDGSYLKKWDEFGDLEGELLLKRAREVGVLQYCDMNQNRADDDGRATVSVRISQASNSALNALMAGGVPEFEVVSELPEYLSNEKLSFKEFVGAIENEAEEQKSEPKKHTPEEPRAYFKVGSFEAPSQCLTLEAESLPSDSGLLILSLAGEIAQIKRRMAARRAILEVRSANWQLGPLIEEKGQIKPTRQPPKIRPLTAFVREKVFFKNPPTIMQEKAIEVALNTPDIALIQGPPGTGKTTVIAAILERLNELADKRGANTKGQVLLTGFQHDAVENMIKRLALNGLPVPKFGKKSGAIEGDFTRFERDLENWCRTIAEELRMLNPKIAETEQETEIRNLCIQYVHAPSGELGIHLVERIASLGVAILGDETSRRAATLSKQLSQQQQLTVGNSDLLSATRRLRIRPESFADDGPERATDALEDLSDILDEKERALLDRASLWNREDGDPPFLTELSELKKKLLLRFSAPPVFRVEKQNDAIIALAEEAIRRIRTAGVSSKDKKSAALAEFLAELESNPYGMMDAVADYSYAFAATCQQSVNKMMQEQKGITGRDVDENQKNIEYNYVIVDEAARVSPRDLMIPMSQGKRIILVGDHRQLPHIVDEAVLTALPEKDAEKLLEQEGEIERDSKNWSKVSLFEHMFSSRLAALEKLDGITRRVTLDKQFRMHPILGDFISRNFYERFDPIEHFGSGRPESDFIHNLPDTNNVPAVWLDVPAEKGKNHRSGTSWTRPVEATAIARQLQAWMNSEAGKALSFGVISFYKAQAELIRKQFGRIAGDDKKLRIGTVDSFQGMEFDVVFLSMVRTLPQNWLPKDDDREKQARKLFGHLCLYNRLNVSMSRQKKLLIVAGDSGLLKNDLAEEFVPGLVDFLKLCKIEGRVLACG